jgi:hypothetical protein
MKSWPLAGALVVIAILFGIGAILYALGILQVATSSSSGPHYKHAIGLGILAIVSLVAANFARPAGSVTA